MMIDYILFFAFSGILVLAFIVQLVYYWGYFTKFSKATATHNDGFFPPVSVIVCARNERPFLEKYLPLFLSLDYPDYELILMNDCSWDGTKEFLEGMEKLYPRLKAHNLNEENLYQHDKKFPLTLGIKAALNNIVVLSDADCFPKSDQWLKEMVAPYKNASTQVVIGYGAYEKEPGFLNKMIRFDTFLIALKYFSSTLKGQTYMATGRNLSYTKELFFKHKGFASHNHIKSGDDDLFIHKVATSTNTAISFSQESHMLSVPKKTFGAWFNQKRRHLTTSFFYKPRHKTYLTLYFLSSFLFLASILGIAICTLIFKADPLWLYIGLGIFILKFTIQIVTFKKPLEKLDERDLLFLIPVLDVMILFFYLAVHVSNLFTRQPRWK